MSAQPAPPPHIQLIQIGTGHWVANMIWAAAEYGLADHVTSTPRSTAEIASELGFHAHSLHRLFRTLSSIGVFSLDAEGRVVHTPMSESLKTGAPGNARSTIRVMAGPVMWNPLMNIGHSLRTGLTAFENFHGMPIFDYFAKHPDMAALFSESMVGIHGPEPPAVAQAYDFSGFKTIVDVGGATGNMLAHILSRYPQPKGILYDLPHVTPHAPALLQAHGVAPRVTIETGSFFDSVPSGGDAYILSHIIHDWNESQCLTILGNVRKAIAPEGKLFIVEFVLPEDNSPHFGKITVIVMLTMPGCEERTAKDYATLLAKAGFKLNRVVPTTTPVGIVEASPV